MVIVQNLTMRYGSRILFHEINLKLDRHKRYGLIGANGAGKTTFLKILSGQINEYEGDIVVENGLKVGVLGQNQFAYENYTIADAVLCGNKRLYDAIKEKEEIYATGDFEDDAVNDRLAELEVTCVEEDPTYEYDVNIAKVLENVGIPASQHGELMSTLDSADKFKVLLAQVLFPKPDVLFLDEPTNHLDMDSIEALTVAIQKFKGSVIIVTHSEELLRRVCDRLIVFTRSGAEYFDGGYDLFLEKMGWEEEEEDEGLENGGEM